MPKGFFITGTDTGVGKTVIAGALIRVLQANGTDTCGMKPIETGCSGKGDALYPSDGMFLMNSAGVEEDIEDIVPYRFETPAAPLVASEREGRDIDVDILIRAFNHLSSRYQAIVVEGAGGLLVPIRRDYFMLHLARDLGLPLIVVSRPAIGTINHTLLTVGYALKEGIEVSGIIMNFNSPRNGTVAEETNPSLLKSLCQVPLFGPFPYLEDLGGESLERAALLHLDTGELLKGLHTKSR
jgi:dethiobiotin synthetase